MLSLDQAIHSPNSLVALVCIIDLARRMKYKLSGNCLICFMIAQPFMHFYIYMLCVALLLLVVVHEQVEIIR